MNSTYLVIDSNTFARRNDTFDDASIDRLILESLATVKSDIVNIIHSSESVQRCTRAKAHQTAAIGLRYIGAIIADYVIVVVIV